MSLVHSGGINFIVHECNACFLCQTPRHLVSSDEELAVKVAQVENLRVETNFTRRFFHCFFSAYGKKLCMRI